MNTKILTLLYEFRRAEPEIQHLVPTLIGPAGVGKTTLVRRWASEMNMPVQVLLLGTMLAEEVLGAPKVIEVNGELRTVWSKPEWLLDQPFVLFLDELDKAREDVVSAALTLLAEGRVRKYFLPKGSQIIAVMQPVDREVFLATRTGQALGDRLVFIPIHAQWNALGMQEGVDLSFLPKSTAFTLPIGDISPRKVIWCIRFIRFAQTRSVTEETIKEVVAGAVGEGAAERLVDTTKNFSELSADDVCRALNRDPALVYSLHYPEVVKLYPSAIFRCNVEVVANFLKRLFLEGSVDEAKEAFRQAQETFDALMQKNGQVEIFGDSTEEQVIQVLTQTAKEIAEVYMKRKCT